MNIPEHTVETAKHVGTVVGDTLAVVVTAGTVSTWIFGVGLPGLAALFTIVWTGFRILNEYEIWKERHRKSETPERKVHGGS